MIDYLMIEVTVTQTRVRICAWRGQREQAEQKRYDDIIVMET